MQFLKDLWANPKVKTAVIALAGAIVYGVLQALGLDPAGIVK